MKAKKTERIAKQKSPSFLSILSGLHALELAVVELGVEAALGQQFVVIALLHDVAVLHHKDDVCLPDGGCKGKNLPPTAFHADFGAIHADFVSFASLLCYCQVRIITGVGYAFPFRLKGGVL